MWEGGSGTGTVSRLALWRPMTRQARDTASEVRIALKRKRRAAPGIGHQIGHQASEDEIDDLLSNPVGRAEIGTGDSNEANDHGSGLGDLSAVGPLHPLKLSPAGA